ncbi:VCBS repeat-containing protein [Snuella lapsa]|uniref:VCBS repeat-containing protein n=1 Tax=Snuella lapsa TaxID=870481 RepID=A0ABP6Y684_9FLAO
MQSNNQPFTKTKTRIAFCVSKLLLLVILSCQSKDKNRQATKELSYTSSNSAQTEVMFNNISKAVGLGNFHYDNGSYGEFFLPEIMGGGVAFIDYNGDNYQDMLLVNGGTMKEGEEQSIDGLSLYKNVEGKTFKDVTKEMGLDNIHAYGFGFTVGDYDNDGDDDFFLATLTHNRLFRNDGSTFTDVSKTSGIYEKNVWSTCAMFIDADRDGLLDIFVGNYAKWSRRKDRSLFCTENGRTDDYCSPDMYIGEPCSFYHNNGDGTFTEDAKQRGLHINAPTKTLGVVEVDYNKDGWPDLFTANDAVPDLVFKNNGDGTYTETGMGMGVGFGVDGAPTAGMGAAVGDVRNDGSHSVFIGNFSKKMMTVFRFSEQGVYVNDSGPSQIGRQSLQSLNFGLSLFDAELDGDLDLFAANGSLRNN